MRITALAGGTGAAKLLRGLARVVDGRLEVRAVVEDIGEQSHLKGGTRQLAIQALDTKTGLLVGDPNHLGTPRLELASHHSKH